MFAAGVTDAIDPVDEKNDFSSSEVVHFIGDGDLAACPISRRIGSSTAVNRSQTAQRESRLTRTCPMTVFTSPANWMLAGRR